MNNEYIDRSRTVLKELRDEEMVIDVLKAQTRRAIEEATAKNLLTEARLNKRLRHYLIYKKTGRSLWSCIKKLHEVHLSIQSKTN